MSDLEAGPSTTCRVEVDEEPPGSPVHVFSCRSSSQVQRSLWPQVFSEPDLLVYPSITAPRAPRSTSKTRAFRRTFFRDCTDKQWNDWRWQARNRIRTLEQLEQMLVLSEEEREGLNRVASMLPVGFHIL